MACGKRSVECGTLNLKHGEMVVRKTEARCGNMWGLDAQITCPNRRDCGLSLVKYKDYSWFHKTFKPVWAMLALPFPFYTTLLSAAKYIIWDPAAHNREFVVALCSGPYSSPTVKSFLFIYDGYPRNCYHFFTVFYHLQMWACFSLTCTVKNQAPKHAQCACKYATLLKYDWTLY